MLMKATSDDDTPTAGYLYQEITGMHVVSGYVGLLALVIHKLNNSRVLIGVSISIKGKGVIHGQKSNTTMKQNWGLPS